jgi:hypothetical protein
MTPREIQEEEWAREAEASPSKHEMRSFYKEYGGKRVRKSKTGMTGGMRDRTAWDSKAICLQCYGSLPPKLKKQVENRMKQEKKAQLARLSASWADKTNVLGRFTS